MTAGVRLVVRIDDAIRALDRAGPAIDRAAHDALEAGAQDIAIEAKMDHDYIDRTGHLTQSIMPGQPEGSLMGGTLTVDVEAGGLAGVDYARYIEEGTRHIRPRRFLAEAAETMEQQIAARLEQSIGDALEEVGL